MKGAAILVHYHTPDLVRPAVEALQRDAEAAGLKLDLVLVDNGSHTGDAAAWQGLPLRVLEPGRNLGYAGGANLGIGRADVDWWIVMNPDVFVRPGCLQALHDELQRGADVAGPRFFWDHEGTWHLPPTERRRRLDELLSVLARCGESWARIARRRWRRHARRHWLAEHPITSFELSGALLALRREAWQRIGPFDEGYRLYFEETDWLERLRRAGGEARFVPGAEAVHLHARSTLAEPRSEGWFVDSARRFRCRYYGPLFNRLLEGLDRGASRRAAGSPATPSLTSPVTELLSEAARERAVWLEASANPAGFPAATTRLPASKPLLTTIEEVCGRQGESRFWLRAIARDGGELARYIV